MVDPLTGVATRAGFAANTGWLLGENALRMVAGVLVGTYVARHLGAGQFGELTFSLAYVSLFASLAKLGLDSVVVKMLVDRPADASGILKTALRLKLLGAGVAFLAIAASLSHLGAAGSERIYVLIIALGLLLQAADVFDLQFQAVNRASVGAKCRMLQLLSSSCLKIAGVLAQAETIWFVAVVLVDQCVLAAALFAAHRAAREPARAAVVSPPFARTLLAEATPIFLSSVLVCIYMRIDQVLVHNLLGPAATGRYVAATTLSEALYAIPTLIATVAFPLIVAARGASRSQFETHSVRLARWLIGTSVLLSLLVTALAGPLVALLYGPAFADAAGALAIHVWSLVPVAYASVFTRRLIADGRQSLLPVITAAALAAEIAGLLYLVGSHGIRGAALAAVVAQTAATATVLLLDAESRREFRRILAWRMAPAGVR